MVIALDLDEVLFPLLRHYVQYINDKYSLNLKESDFSTYDLWDFYGVSKEQGVIDFHEYTKTSEFEKIKPLEGAVEGISQLKSLSDLIVVTSRHEKLRKITEENLDKYFPGDFSEVILGKYPSLGSNSIKTKRQICNEKRAWVLVEDSAEHAKEASNDIYAILLDKPWNQGVSGENILRANNWDDILKTTTKLHSELFT